MLKPCFVIFCLLLPIFLTACQLPAKPTPPGQPRCGPGGSQYRHNQIRKYVFGQGDSQYWIYEPDDPAPKSAPVVVFNHGWIATNPKIYGGWIMHLVRRGNIVIYSRYQASILTPTKVFVPNTAHAVQEALTQLEQPGHVRPMLDKVAMVGHSAGGTITANLAAEAREYGLPHFKAIMCVEPAWQLAMTTKGAPFEDLSKIPSSTLLLTVAGDSDRMVGDAGAKEIYTLTTSIPPANKNLIYIHSDHHGSPPLQADHLAPLSCDGNFNNWELFDLSNFSLAQCDRQTTDALDYYGFWKLFDALTDAAFYGKYRNYALGDTSQQRFLGNWSDGQPVKEMMACNE